MKIIPVAYILVAPRNSNYFPLAAVTGVAGICIFLVNIHTFAGAAGLIKKAYLRLTGLSQAHTPPFSLNLGCASNISRL